MIAFLHTLSANINKFEVLAKAYAPMQEIKHFVNEELLVNALNTGTTDYSGFNTEVESIKTHHPELIICTCSSYGEACDRRTDIERIDRPIVEHIINKYQKIGLAYAAISTRNISENLIVNTAKAMNINVKIVDIDCTAAWAYHTNNMPDEYARHIAHCIKEQSDDVEVIFLAQASMEGAMVHLEKHQKEVLSSPDYGVEFYLNKR